MMKWIPAAALAVSLCPLSAFADAADSYGIDSRAQAMGGAGAALVTGGAAAYYNPAAVAAIERSNLTLGALFAETTFPDSGQVVVAYVDGLPVIDDVRNTTESVGGFLLTGSVRMKDRFALGLLVYHPFQRTLRLQAQNPFIPTYSLYDNRQQRLTLNASFGARIVDGLHVGIGTSILAVNKFGAGFNVPAGDEDPNASDGFLGLDIIPTATPTGGVRFDLGAVSNSLEGLTLGATYRGEIALPVDITFSSGADVLVSAGPTFTFRARTAVAADIPITEHYTPQQVVVGLAWDKPDSPIAAAVDLTWMQWSAYEGPYIDPEFEPIVVPPLGEVGVNWRVPPTDQFRDTIVPRAGVEWRKRDGDVIKWALRAGYSFEPSPIPLQTGETNRLDGDKHVATAGAAYSFPAPFGMTEAPITLNVHGQFHSLVERTAVKDVQFDCGDPNERPPVGYPCSGEITSGGSILSGGAALTLRF